MSESKFITCRTYDNQTQEVPAEELQFRPSVYGIIIRDNAVLLSRQWDGYDFPGGGIEKGERIGDALAREIHEETGMTARINKLVHVADDFFLTIRSKRPIQSTLLYYTCTNISGEISSEFLDGNEKTYMQAAEWIPLNRIDDIKFYNSINSPELIRKALTSS